MISLNSNYTLEQAIQLTGIDADVLKKRVTNTNGLYLGYDIHRCGLLMAIERFNRKFGGQRDEI